jgi:3-hydroxyisobutyrate dehydrogenase-like beta-hydroxyacid dehydrogenase
LAYAIDGASRDGVGLQTASAALSVFEQAIAEGLGDEDFSAVAKSPKKQANL